MKIVYFVDGLNRGGVESVVCHLSSSFAKLRNKIYIICLHKDMNDLHLEIPEYISVFYLPFESNRNHHVNYIRYLPNLVDLLKYRELFRLILEAYILVVFFWKKEQSKIKYVLSSIGVHVDC